MGFFDSIFNPTGGGTERISTQTAGQSEVLKILNDLLSGQIGQGISPFQGTRPGEVPFGPIQQQAFGLAQGLTPGISSGFDAFNQALSGFDQSQGRGFLGQAENALQRGLRPVDTQAISDAFAPSRQLALNTFEQDIIPFLGERFGASSGASGAFNKQLAESGANLSLGLAAQQAPFAGQAALQAPGVQQAGAAQFANLAGIPGQLAQQGTQFGGQAAELLNQLFNIGGLQQQLPIGQAGAAQDRFAEAQAFNNPFLALLGPALGTQAFQAFQKPSGPSQFSQVAGLFGSSGAFGGGSQGGAFGPFT